MISKRLELVASFVPQGAILLDVGSDHAYLPIELVGEVKSKAPLRVRVVEGPTRSAVKNVEAHSLKEKIQVRLANGLAAFEEADRSVCHYHCWYGGRLITRISEEGWTS